MYMYRNIYHNDARKHLMLLVAMFYVPEKTVKPWEEIFVHDKRAK